MNSSLQQSLSQQQNLTPQMQQNLRILQAHSLELFQTIKNELNSNIFLEEAPSLPSLDAASQPAQPQAEENPSPLEASYNSDSWLLHQPTTPISSEKLQFLEDSLTEQETLESHLLNQLETTPPPSENLRKAAEILIQNLNDQGQLSSPIAELSQLFSIPQTDFRKAQRYLQQFDPPGIAADSLTHSLILQLENLPSPQPARPLAREILANHLPLLAGKKIAELAKILGVTPQKIYAAAKLITSLNPKPAANFSRDFNPDIAPDIIVFPDENGELEMLIPDHHLPKLGISKIYHDLLSSPKLNTNERNNLRNQLKDARSLINGLAFRQSTLELLGQNLLSAQHDFFTKGPNFILPLTMNDFAETMQVHPTTVSRTVANKFIQTPFGIFPLRILFTSGYETQDGSSISDSRIKSLIRQFIQNEPPSKPLSDAKISDLLAKEGIPVARRTIAKYRDQLGILPTNLRKKL